MRFEAPTSIDGAVSLLAGETGITRCLAGGTDVLVQLRSGMIEPDLVVDIKRIPGMADITEEDGGFRIGAAVPGAAMAEHSALKAAWPGVVEAANLVGSTQIHARATMAGNLCTASPAADTVPAMIAANAMVRVHGPNGVRDIPAADVAVGPGKTSLSQGEIIGSIFLPARPGQSGDAYLRFIPRTEMDIAVVSAGVSLVMDGDIVSDARVAIGAAAPTCRLVPDGAKTLVGRTVAQAEEELAAAARAACSPISDKRGTIEFRTKVAGTLAVRAARIAAERAKG